MGPLSPFGHMEGKHRVCVFWYFNFLRVRPPRDATTVVVYREA